MVSSSPPIFLFLGCLALLLSMVLILRGRQRVCGRTSCLMRLQQSPASILNVQHRRDYSDPHKAERALQDLGHKSPHLRNLLCRKGGKWTIISGENLTIMTTTTTTAANKDDGEYFYFIQTTPLMNPTTTVHSPPTTTTTVEMYVPPTTATATATAMSTQGEKERVALRPSVLSDERVRTSRHGTIVAAREDFYRQWEQLRGTGSVFLLRSLHRSDTSWYVLSSKKKSALDELFDRTPSAHMLLLEHRS